MSVSQSWAEGYSRSSNSSCEATSYQRNVDQAALVFDTRLSSRALETLFTLDFHFWAHTSFSATHLHHPCPALLERVLSRGRGHMYTYSWFRLIYGRNQQTQFCKTIVFQLKIKNLKEEMNKSPFPPTFKKKKTHSSTSYTFQLSLLTNLFYIFNQLLLNAYNMLQAGEIKRKQNSLSTPVIHILLCYATVRAMIRESQSSIRTICEFFKTTNVYFIPNWINLNRTQIYTISKLFSKILLTSQNKEPKEYCWMWKDDKNLEVLADFILEV